MPVYLALQLIGYAASGVATGAGRLLPCLFTLTADLAASGGYFLSYFPRRRRLLSVKKYDALCCPDFPPKNPALRRPTALLPVGFVPRLNGFVRFFIFKSVHIGRRLGFAAE